MTQETQNHESYGEPAEAIDADGTGPVSEDPRTVLADAVAEAAKYKDLALRALADLDNFRKRSSREKEESIRYANMSLVERLLPVLDSFDLGLEAARSAKGSEAVVSGFEMVRRRLSDFLKDAGIETVDASGQVFDPNHHEAMGSEASLEVPEGTVIKQLRCGYKLKDRLIRAAGVVVSKGPPAGP